MWADLRGPPQEPLKRVSSRSLPSPGVPWDRLEAMSPGWLVLPSTHLTSNTESFVEVTPGYTGAPYIFLLSRIRGHYMSFALAVTIMVDLGMFAFDVTQWEVWVKRGQFLP